MTSKLLVLSLAAGCAAVGPSAGTDPAGGKADDGSTSGDITAWPTRPIKLSTDHAVALDVSPDGARVAYSRDAADYTAWGCWGRAGIGDLQLVDVASPDHPVAVSSLAGFRESAFTSDSQWLVYTQYTAGTNPCSDQVSLAAVPSSGGNVAWLHLGITYYYKQLGVAGTSVAFSAFGGAANDPGTLYYLGLPGGAGGGYVAYGAGKTTASPDPTGQAIVYDAPDGHLHLRSRAGTAEVDLSTTYPATGAPVWSPDGSLLAISWVQGESRAVTVMARDGSNPRTLLGGCDRDAVFSPDGSTIACLGGWGSGKGTLAVARVADGTSFTLGGLPDPQPGNGWWYFTSDGGFVHYVDAGASFLAYSLYVAPIAAGASFTQVTDSLDLEQETYTAAHDRLAYVALDASYVKSLVVVQPNGDHTTAIASGAETARYEQATAAPRLAVVASDAMELLAGDGSGPAVSLPGKAERIPAPLWSGRTVLYAVNKRSIAGEDAYDLIAASDDGAQVGVVLSGVTRVAQARQGNRLFLARAAGVGGGVYVFDL
ncbi:MAG: TolB family protein [Acidobacteriota bacterium]